MHGNPTVVAQSLQDTPSGLT